MDIRVDINSKGSETVICVAGRLTGNLIVHLKKACDSIEKPFAIDLSNLVSVDDDGITAIRELADKGAQVRGVSPFTQLLLDTEPE